LPGFRFHLALCALIAAASASGCTSTAQVLDIDATASLAADPALPDQVDIVPSAGPTAAMAEAGGAAIVPTAYAAPAPAASAISAITTSARVAPRSPALDALIAKYAAVHQIPEELLRRVVKRESTFDPAARNGPYWGLMQILPQTARTMGYRGKPEGLLDAETNLMYAGKYLRGAYLTAGGDHDQAVRFYSRGYYYDAKRKGLLDETGLGRDRRRM
jgi:soluble lytic murein transglycosylase-like protein